MFSFSFCLVGMAIKAGTKVIRLLTRNGLPSFYLLTGNYKHGCGHWFYANQGNVFTLYQLWRIELDGYFCFFRHHYQRLSQLG